MVKLFDNTRVSSHRTCNRLYYFRHNRDLAPSGIAAPLVFGDCWHTAMDVVWQSIKDMPELDNDTVGELAFEAFNQKWAGYGLPKTSDMTEQQVYEFRARTPDTAFYMLRGYIEKRRKFIESVELLAIEKPFAVKIYNDDREVYYVGRLDKIIKWNGRVWTVEHKTTSWGTAKSGFNSNYVDSFTPNSQIDGYLHATHMLYGKATKGVLVDMALCLPNNYEHFMFLPIERSLNNLDAWLWETRREIELIELNKEELQKVNPKDPFMAAFPKNTGSCLQFMRPCAYMDVCKTIPNPHEDPNRIYAGFKEDHWSPFNEIKLQEIGINKED